jgi:hypothetical protein
VVHVVELVGVTTAEDVVGEVGSVLGVRDSVSAQRTLTPEQRLDVRSRIAQRLAQGPSLLVLDNCEHVIDAAAELVAFLVSATADLRVLTTSRAPLEIGAEHVYLLGELGPARRGRAVPRPRARRAPRRRAARGDRAQHRDPARRPPAGDRAGRREGPRDGGRGDQPAPRGPLRAAARAATAPRPTATRPCSP